uniref:Uncharacterized protein n=1 Tax=Anguilla anguilla TaxID=7936 RepID=A0A0E9X423_ANGAN
MLQVIHGLTTLNTILRWQRLRCVQKQTCWVNLVLFNVLYSVRTPLPFFNIYNSLLATLSNTALI